MPFSTSIKVPRKASSLSEGREDVRVRCSRIFHGEACEGIATIGSDARIDENHARNGTCGLSFAPLPAGSVAGRAGVYDYLRQSSVRQYRCAPRYRIHHPRGMRLPPPSVHRGASETGISPRLPWTPDNPLVALKRYLNQTAHEVTTGWVDPNGGFSLESTPLHLYQSPQQGATVPFYGCKDGATDYFVSLDSPCKGSRILGKNGYGYSRSVVGLNKVALYRCSTGHYHFVSADPKCDGQSVQELPGYVLP